MKKIVSLLLIVVLLMPTLALCDTVSQYKNQLTPYPATLNQKMATRTGPGTEYSEALGTLPQDTAIVAYVLEGDTPWVMVEYHTGNGLVRCYTGKKRVDSSANLPYLQYVNAGATVNQTLTPRYGPGTQYALCSTELNNGLNVTVIYDEQGYALIDYTLSDVRNRCWVPLSALNGYSSTDGIIQVEQPQINGVWHSGSEYLALLDDGTFVIKGQDSAGTYLVQGTYSQNGSALILQVVLSPYGRVNAGSTLVYIYTKDAYGNTCLTNAAGTASYYKQSEGNG